MKSTPTRLIDHRAETPGGAVQPSVVDMNGRDQPKPEGGDTRRGKEAPGGEVEPNGGKGPGETQWGAEESRVIATISGAQTH